MLYNKRGDYVKNKKILTVILISIILIIISGLVIYFCTNKFKIKLKSTGYNSLETNEILKLSDAEIKEILKYKYNENFIFIIKSDNYNSKKIDLYLKYVNLYNDVYYLKIFNLINNKDIDIKKIDQYIELLKQYNDIEGIILYVNNYSHSNIKFNETTLSFIKEKYFIEDYLERYLKYYENHKDLSFKEIVTRINSNLDYKFYEDVKTADLTKGMFTLVNKYNYLESNFVPNDLETISYTYAVNNTKLNKIALENFIKMYEDASKENINFKITTAYRDYNFQSILYNNYVNSDGKDLADTYSARPGYSEHQLGYSFDLTNESYADFGEFEYTDEYKWLQENAYKYGFILRYPKDKEYITGYVFESWHYRYVGTDIATYIHKNNITYEEYYSFFLR